MGFLIKADFEHLIPLDELDIIINSDETILNEAMRSSIEEAKSYLRQRYDMALSFFDVVDWNMDQNFTTSHIVVLSANQYKNGTNYAIGDLVYYENGSDDVYICIQAAHNNIPTDTAYWTAIGKNNALYTCIQAAQGQYPNNATYFEQRDDRNHLLMRLIANITLYELHSRINPRNIPTFRIERRDDAIKYLTKVADPRNNIEIDLPLVDHGEQKGLDISYGSSELTNNHTY